MRRSLTALYLVKSALFLYLKQIIATDQNSRIIAMQFRASYSQITMQCMSLEFESIPIEHVATMFSWISNESV